MHESSELEERSAELSLSFDWLIIDEKVEKHHIMGRIAVQATC